MNQSQEVERLRAVIDIARLALLNSGSKDPEVSQVIRVCEDALATPREESVDPKCQELVKALRLCGNAIVDIEWKGSQSTRHGGEVMLSDASYDRLMVARDHLRKMAQDNSPAFQEMAALSSTEIKGETAG